MIVLSGSPELSVHLQIDSTQQQGFCFKIDRGRNRWSPRSPMQFSIYRTVSWVGVAPRSDTFRRAFRDELLDRHRPVLTNELADFANPSRAGWVPWTRRGPSRGQAVDFLLRCHFLRCDLDVIILYGSGWPWMSNTTKNM